MDDRSANENPFDAPKTDDAPPLTTEGRPIHPLLLFVLFVFSLLVGGCVFFCTCLGMVVINLDANFLWVCGAIAVLAIIVTFFALTRLIRRSRRRAQQHRPPMHPRDSEERS